MKVGYIQARRIKDIEVFQVTANVDKIAVDLLDESDKSNSEGEVFAKLLSEISAGDVIVLQGLSNLPYNDVSELCSFLGSMKEMAVEVQLIDESDGQPLLSDEGFEALSYLQGYIQQKDSQKKKIGRPAKKFADNFYEVYLEYRNKNIKADSAASKLKLNKPKFYELVRLFES
ncbi:hypothetical protein [Paenibacillus sp. EPM92]|uniref:hypothetical protein n=1 Tax=Paenibacillus sp. EPM92 TaxID=1561195 RepID=UPI0019164C67|nr:hypothetical protein [Paenibacillus sp. EPM92]